MDFDADQFLDTMLYDQEGHQIGTVTDVYVDDVTGRPEWLLVNTGFIPRGSHVPARGAEPHEDGYQLPYARDKVKSAPELDITSEELSEEDEGVLYLYYGIPTEETPSGAGTSAEAGAGEETDKARRDEREAA
jgi:hypothetical protein